MFSHAHAQAKPALLCVHGSAATGRFWAPLTESLHAHLDVVTPDRVGCGRGERWSPGASASFAAEARHLEPYLHTHPEGVHLLAHSYGAAVALELALRWPHRVSSLTMYEPSRFALLFGAEKSDDERNEIVSLGRTIILWVVSGRSRAAAALFMDYWTGAGAFDALDERRQDIVTSNMPKVAAEFESAFGDPVPVARFADLAMPVRLLCGSESPAPVRRIVGILDTLLPNAETIDLPGLGHMGPMTNPSRVLQHMPDCLMPIAIHEPG